MRKKIADFWSWLTECIGFGVENIVVVSNIYIQSFLFLHYQYIWLSFCQYFFPIQY